MIKKLLFSSLMVLTVSSTLAQTSKTLAQLEERPISLQKEFYIQGDATTIGNNILSEHASKDYNEIGLINDRVEMKYVDIDNESSTFSSSSAKLKLPQDTKKIKYAALYWSATYGFKKGYYKTVNKKKFVKGTGKRETTINYIKFKTPNQEYKNIKGQIIFDGHDKKIFAANSPYVCYADVTSILQNADRNGFFTVANVRATEGIITGGSSAGWVLYVVYEQENATPKHIKTYHGLSLLNKKALDIKFEDFKTPESGQVKASISMAAIEGDAKLKTDKISVFNKKDNMLVVMSSEIRPENNFFNSTITKNEEIVTTRMPKSQNTLGFDLVEFDLPNAKNALLANNQNDLDFNVYTKADRFYLFFTAFKTDISESCYLANNLDENSNIVNRNVLKEAKPVVGNIEGDE